MTVAEHSRAVTVRDDDAIARRPLPEVELPEVGRLRLGSPQQPIVDKQTGKPRLKDGKPVMKMGAPLDFFRVTASIREDVEELARVYGDIELIEPWESPDGPQWQTVLTQPVLHVALPPYSDTLVGPQYEAYNAGHYLTRCCDGRTCWVPNREAQRWEERSCLCDPENPECAQVTRLKVVVLGVPAHGVWRVECHGAYAARHWPAQVRMAQDLAHDGHAVPATIRIESKIGRSAVFGKAHYKVPVLRLEQPFVLPAGERRTLLDGPPDGAEERVHAQVAEPATDIPPDDEPIDGDSTEIPDEDWPPTAPESEPEQSARSTADSWQSLTFRQAINQPEAIKRLEEELRPYGLRINQLQKALGESPADLTLRQIVRLVSGGE